MKANPNERVTFYGMEKNPTTIRLAKMNLAVHGLEGDIQKAISYYEDPHKDQGPYDFVIKLNGEAVKVDVKCKKRTVKPCTDYDAHVTVDQKDYDCRIYVFASMTDEIVSFMGWCGKQEFWDSAKLVSKGEKDSQGFSERTGAGKIKYNQLRSMLNFLEIAKKQ